MENKIIVYVGKEFLEMLNAESLDDIQFKLKDVFERRCKNEQK